VHQGVEARGCTREWKPGGVPESGSQGVYLRVEVGSLLEYLGGRLPPAALGGLLGHTHWVSVSQALHKKARLKITWGGDTAQRGTAGHSGAHERPRAG